MVNFSFRLPRHLAVVILVAGSLNTGVVSLARSEEKRPEGTVLTISGKIENGSPVFLDMATIRRIPAVTFSTYDPWDHRERSYKGPLIMAILELARVDASASRIEVVASNDYRIPIRISDLKRIGHIMSYEMDGLSYEKHTKPTNKGPLAVAIHFEKNDIEVEIYKHHLAWWVTDIIVE